MLNKASNKSKREHNGLRVWLVLILGLMLISPNFVYFEARAAQIQTSVIVMICGNGSIEGTEACDDGANNGAGYGYCNADCASRGPRCGDGTVQSGQGEQCDDSNTTSGDGCSATCQTEAAAPYCGDGSCNGSESCSSCSSDCGSCGGGSSGGGGGGGGGYTPVSATTNVVLQGMAYPLAKITVLKDGKVATIITADKEASFKVEISSIEAGTYTFGLWAEDKEGRRSITFSFTTAISEGMTTTVGGIFIPPTITLSKSQITKGSILDVTGQTAPVSEVVISIQSSEITASTTASLTGEWDYSFNTAVLEEGSHIVKAKAETEGGLLSSYSKVLSFNVGRTTAVIIQKADANSDNKVNLVDFSILLYNWGAPKNTAVDFNNDGRVNLTDFSIMLYYWTG